MSVVRGGQCSFQSAFYFSALSLMNQAGDQRRVGFILGTVPHIFLEHNDNDTDVPVHLNAPNASLIHQSSMEMGGEGRQCRLQT